MWVGRQKAQWREMSIHDGKNDNLIWFHFASVGEFEQGLPLLERFKAENNYSKFILTFFSSSGYEFVKKKYPSYLIYYLPFDTRHAMTQFIDMLKPSMLVIVKYEFWFNMLYILHLKQIPVYLISAVFRPDQVFFKSWGSFFKRHLHYFSHIFVQDNRSKELLNKSGVLSVSVTGDTRFDRVIQNSQQDFTDDKILRFIGQHKIFIAGSTWESDLPALRKLIQYLSDDWKVIIVPHEVTHFNYAKIDWDYVLYTESEDISKKVMIVDTLGLLSKLYRFANLVYIGGGFETGIHNTLEAAVYKIPVLFGPKWQKFNEARHLIELGCAFDVTDTDFYQKSFSKLLSDRNFYEEIQAKLAVYFQANANATEKIYVQINTQM